MASLVDKEDRSSGTRKTLDALPVMPGPSVPPQRERREPDRLGQFAPAMLAAHYVEFSGVGMTGDANVRPHSFDAVYSDPADIDRRYEQLVMSSVDEVALNQPEQRARALSDAEALRAKFNDLDITVQRAACIMADHAMFAREFGAVSPQAKMARTAYAAAMVDAASWGYKVAPLDPYYTLLPSQQSGHAKQSTDYMDTALNAVQELEAAAFKRGAKVTEPPGSVHVGGNARELDWFNVASGGNALEFRYQQIFDDAYDGCFFAVGGDDMGDLLMVAKKKTAPDIFNEWEMKGPEWDEPKSIEVNQLEKMGAYTWIAADDPFIRAVVAAGRVTDTMFCGRIKRNADRSICQRKGRCVLRGDLHKQHYKIDGNQSHAPVVRNTSMDCCDANGVLECDHEQCFDVGSAYLRGDQRDDEQVVARPPVGFRRYDERGVELLWLMWSPLYGQGDAGAIWNRTFNDFATNGTNAADMVNNTSRELQADVVAAVARPAALQNERNPWAVAAVAAKATANATVKPAVKQNQPEVEPLGMRRCPHDPCIYSSSKDDGSGRCTMPLYVDDGMLKWPPTPASDKATAEIRQKLEDKFEIKFGEIDAPETYFLGANRHRSAKGDVLTIRAYSYIQSMVERYCNGSVAECKEYPGSWGLTPADDELERAYEEAILTRTPADKGLYTEYNSIVGSLRHVVKYRPEISAAMDLLGCCLTFPTRRLLRCAYRVLVYLGRTPRLGRTFTKHGEHAARLHARADANWRSTRSTTGYCIFLANVGIVSCCQRQGCISMSTTEAELVALAQCAVELIYIMNLLAFIGYVCKEDVVVETDNSGAHQLCHRYTSAAHTRHIDRKLFKLREMRGAGLVKVKYVPTDENTADLFTKILPRHSFEKHRKVVLNTAAGEVTDEVAQQRRAAHLAWLPRG